jgi:ornithine cyclodeaminase/alanine dehydrogenase-like protein (mu-crystallin family)
MTALIGAAGPVPVPFLDGSAIDQLMPMPDAIAVLQEAWRSAPLDNPEIPRAVTPVPRGLLLSMPATLPGALGIKIVTVAQSAPSPGPPRVNGVYVLFDAAGLTVQAILDAASITRLRTPAVSAVAARMLAVPDAEVLVIFGTGIQARGHALAMTCVRPVSRVCIVGRQRAAADALASELRRPGLDARAGEPGSVAGADIVCTCTTSPEPVFDGRLLSPSAHVTAIGSFQPGTREVDDYTAAHSAIVVESRASALAEAGDILIPLASGVIAQNAIVADLSELTSGAAAVDPNGLTLFKSVGVAFEDLVIAQEIVRRHNASMAQSGG